MSLKAITWAMDQDLDPVPKLVLMILGNFCDENDTCYPAHSEIMRVCRIASRTTVRRHLQALEDGGFITKQPRQRDNGGKSSNLYLLNRAPQHVVDPWPKSDHGGADHETADEPQEQQIESEPESDTPWSDNDHPHGQPTGHAHGQLSDHAIGTFHSEPKNLPQTPSTHGRGFKVDLSEWTIGEALMNGICQRIHGAEPHFVTWALSRWKEEMLDAGRRTTAPGKAFESWLTTMADGLRTEWWNRARKDWTVGHWHAQAFLCHPMVGVKSLKWYTGSDNPQVVQQAYPDRHIPPALWSVRKNWDRETLGPEPWLPDTLVPTALVEAFAPWWTDKTMQLAKRAAVDTMETGLAEGQAVRVAPEWRPTADDYAAISRETGLSQFVLENTAVDFARTMARLGAEKNTRVKDPLTSFRRWISKRLDKGELKPAGAKAKGSDPKTVDEWRAFLGDIADEKNRQVKQRMWATLLKDARPQAQVNPWHQAQEAIPTEVFLAYGRAWGWYGFQTTDKAVGS